MSISTANERQPLVERAAELEAVRELIHRAARGSGSALLVEGPAGIGKTSVLRAAKARAEDAGFLAFTARGGSLETDYPYGVVRQLFGRALQPGDPLLAGAAELAAVALGFESRSGDTNVEEYSVCHGLFWLVCNIADRTPVVLVADDLHWADTASLRFLLFLVRRLEDLPIAVVAGTRDVSAPVLKEFINEPAVSTTRPSLLSLAGSREVVRARTTASATHAFEDACHQATGGNPHLLCELLVSLQADGLPPDDETALRVPTITPAGVSRSVLVRLASLDADAARLAHAIAVLGDRVEVRHAAALAELDVDRAGLLADDLVTIFLLAPGRPLEVVHPLIGEVLRSDMSTAERGVLHRQAARLLHADGVDAQRVAAHLDMTDPAGDAWTVGVLREAADRARAEGATDTARRWLERALAEGVPSARPILLLQLGSLLTYTDDVRSAPAVLREAVETATDAAIHARAAIALSYVYLFLEEDLMAWEALSAALTDAKDDEARSRLRTQLAWVRVTNPCLRQTLTTEELDTLAPIAADDPEDLDAQCRMAMWHMLHGRNAKAAALALRATVDVDRLVEAMLDHHVQAMTNLLTMADQHDRARLVLEAWFEKSRRQGSLAGFANASQVQALLEWHAGDVVSCETMAKTCLDSDGWFTGAKPMLFALCSLVLVERGDLDGAFALAQQAVEQTVQALDISLYARARANRVAGRIGEAVADLEVIADLDRQGLVAMQFPLWRLEMAECTLARGDHDATRRWLSEHTTHTRDFDTPSVTGATLRVTALASTGDERIEGLRCAVGVLRPSVARLEYARALVDLGAALRAIGHRSEAQAPLRDGADLAQHCGATALAERARDELVATGARPRRVRTTGVDALTGAERRVVELAVEDRSNVAIAQALFLTRSTVEKHLTSAYRKLAITSRAELAAALTGKASSGAPPLGRA